jgi:hypothetical protein
MIFSANEAFNSGNIKILSIDFETRLITGGDNNDNTRSQIFAR